MSVDKELPLENYQFLKDTINRSNCGFLGTPIEWALGSIALNMAKQTEILERLVNIVDRLVPSTDTRDKQ